MSKTGGCSCDDWRNYIGKIDGAFAFMQNHGFSFNIEKGEWKFIIYCPWCGKKLPETIKEKK